MDSPTKATFYTDKIIIMNFIRNSQGEVKIVLVLLFLALINGGIFGSGYLSLLKQKAETIINQQLLNIAISDWKTYRDDKFGFQLKYPQEWVITTKEESVNIGEEAEKIYSIFSGNLIFDIFVTSKNIKDIQILEALLETPIRNVLEIYGITYSVQGNFNVSGLTGVIYHADYNDFLRNHRIFVFPSMAGEAMIKGGENIFHFTLRRIGNEEIAEENKEILSQILSTLRFTK